MEGLAAMGGILGPLLQYQGTRETNAANIDMANAATAANISEAEKNRQFQERMSSTAHQREVEDLRRAGISPMLGSMSGSSTPAGGQASAQTAKLENPFSGASSWFNSAIDGLKTMGEIKLQDKQGKLLDAQTKKTGVDTEVGKRYLPESDAKNKIYQILNKKLDEATKYSAPKEQEFGVQSYDPATRKFKFTKP